MRFCRTIRILLACLTAAGTLAACGKTNATSTAVEAENNVAEEARQKATTGAEQEEASQETEEGKEPSNQGSCLSPTEVEREVNAIASGVEGSQAEVEAKQDAIREVRQRACK